MNKSSLEFFPNFQHKVIPVTLLHFHFPGGFVGFVRHHSDTTNILTGANILAEHLRMYVKKKKLINCSTSKACIHRFLFLLFPVDVDLTSAKFRRASRVPESELQVEGSGITSYSVPRPLSRVR